MKKFLFFFCLLAANTCLLFIFPNSSVVAQPKSPPNIQAADTIWTNQEHNLAGVDETFNSPDTNFMFANCFREYFIKIDLRNGHVIDKIGGKGIIGGISADGKYIYTYGDNLNVYKLEINTYQLLDSTNNKLDITNGSLEYLRILPDGRLMYSINQGKYLFVILDGNNLEVLSKIRKDDTKYDYGCNHLAISPKGDYFVADQAFDITDSMTSKHWYETWLWDLKTLKPIMKIFDNQDIKNTFNFSPDGRLFILDSKYIHYIFKTDSFKIVNQFYGYCVDFSADSKFITCGLGVNYIIIDTDNIKNQFCGDSTIKFSPSRQIKFAKDINYIYYFDIASAMCKIISCLTNTGIIEPVRQNNMLYPNPTTNKLTIINSTFLNMNLIYQILTENGIFIFGPRINEIKNSFF